MYVCMYLYIQFNLWWISTANDWSDYLAVTNRGNGPFPSAISEYRRASVHVGAATCFTLVSPITSPFPQRTDSHDLRLKYVYIYTHVYIHTLVYTWLKNIQYFRVAPCSNVWCSPMPVPRRPLPPALCLSCATSSQAPNRSHERRCNRRVKLESLESVSGKWWWWLNDC